MKQMIEAFNRHAAVNSRSEAGDEKRPCVYKMRERPVDNKSVSSGTCITQKPAFIRQFIRSGKHTVRTIVAVIKLHDSRSQQNRTTLLQEQLSPDEWTQLRTSRIAKLATLYWWLGRRTERGGGGGGPFVALGHAIWWHLLSNNYFCSVFQQNWRLRPAPITSTVAWKEVKLEGGGGIKYGNMEHTAVPNVPLRNAGFQWILIVLLNVFSCKESSTREHCVLIRELRYSNTRLQQRRLQHYN
jgi:hypothetical protein